MAERRVFDGFRILSDRSFWSFRVAHALVGGLLTIGAAAGTLYINDGLKKRLTLIDGRIAERDARIEAIRATLAQFRVVQSNGVLLGALASSDALRAEYREHYINLMFVLRRTPAMAMLGELYLDDTAALLRERDRIDAIVAAAVKPDRSKQSWDAMLEFETSRERQVMDLQDRLRIDRLRLEDDRRRLEASTQFATLAGFIVQQVGFVIILLAGLLYEHGGRVLRATHRADDAA